MEEAETEEGSFARRSGDVESITHIGLVMVIAGNAANRPFAAETIGLCFLFAYGPAEPTRRSPGSAAMSFRTKVFLIFLVTVLASVSLVAYGVTRYTRAAFEERDRQLTEALVTQFQNEFKQRSDELTRQMKNLADNELTYRVAIDLAARPNLDQSIYVHEANGSRRKSTGSISANS